MKLNGRIVRFFFVLMRGVHNLVVRNDVAVKPLRAGAHSPVQARLFRYYAFGYESPHFNHKKQAETICLPFYFATATY